LHLALRNRMKDVIRRAQRRGAPEALDSAKPDDSPSPFDQAIGRETIERYEAALSRLKPEEQAELVLSLEMGCSHEAIAGGLGKPSAAAARMALSRALLRLAKEMSSDRRASRIEPR